MTPQTLIQTGRTQGVGVLFDQGVDSFSPPEFIPASSGKFYWAENAVNRGGVWQSRPGYKTVLDCPDGLAQGFTVFTPTGGSPYLVVAISGSVYVTTWPNKTIVLKKLPVSFRKSARFVYFCSTVQSQKHDSAGTLTNISAKNILVMQDGFSRPWYWDGNKCEQINPEPGYTTTVDSGGNKSTIFDNTKNGTPIGTAMTWAGNRLWVGSGTTLHASDVNNPLEFTEEVLYGSFQTNDTIMGMTPTVGKIGATDYGLLVLTETQGWTLNAIYTNRAGWATTTDFMKLTVLGVGCASTKSVIRHWGQVYWMSNFGLTNFDFAKQTMETSALRLIDNEMSVSKGNLSLDFINRACAFSHEMYFGLSVPSGGVENEHTWVFDLGSKNNSETSPVSAWQGIWTGIRPVEWASVSSNGQQRVFCLSQDAQSVNGTSVRIWEAFAPQRADNGYPIYSRLFTNAYGNESMADYKRFRYAELGLTEIYGNVHLKAYLKGTKGGYHQILDKKIIASGGNVGRYLPIQDTTKLEGWTTQNRRVFTQNVPDNLYYPDSVSGIEGDMADTIDTTFGLQIEWTGRLGLRNLRLFYDQDKGDASRPLGKMEPNETGIKAVNENGQGLSNRS